MRKLHRFNVNDFQKTRLVAVIDLEVPDYATAGRIEQKWAKFVDNFVVEDPTGKVKLIQAQSMMGARRGEATGPISNIVFRN